MSNAATRTRLENAIAHWRAIQSRPAIRLTDGQAAMVGQTIAELERRLAALG